MSTWILFVGITTIIGFIIKYIIFAKPNPKAMLTTKYGVNRLMRLHTQFRLKLPPKLALITDLDHTLIGQHSNQTHKQCNDEIKRFNDIWCNKYAPNNCVLIYATGRNFEKYELAVSEWDILKPDVLISQDGVNIHWFNKSLAQLVEPLTLDNEMDTEQFICYDESWQSILEHGWNQELAQQIHDELNEKYTLLPLPPASKSIEPFRLGVLCEGYDLAKEVQQYIIQKVNEYNEMNKNKDGFITMNIHTFSGAERYQENAYWSAVTPAMAGKGSAVQYLKERLGLDNERIVCIGDSGNDISMMELQGVKSVVVANASHELVHFYNEKCECNDIIKTAKPNTLGVIEGLEYYGAPLIDIQTND